VLLKPGPLDAGERTVIETHTLIGDHLLEPLDLLASARPIVRHHHERWDGTGYPDGLAGEEIPLGARIVAVADAVEAMSAERVYRKALSIDQIIAELRIERGAAWDPRIVDLALDSITQQELVA
jgi:HD-GYP domain-containing protein (c-di-GMP phosphodiesterase class II)